MRKRVTDALALWFPDREFFMRSQGQIKFVKVSARLQMTVAGAVVAALLLWLVVTLAMLVSQYSISMERMALVQRQAEIESSASRVKAYRSSVEDVAKDLEKRQAFLEDIVTSYIGEQAVGEDASAGLGARLIQPAQRTIGCGAGGGAVTPPPNSQGLAPARMERQERGVAQQGQIRPGASDLGRRRLELGREFVARKPHHAALERWPVRRHLAPAQQGPQVAADVRHRIGTAQDVGPSPVPREQHAGVRLLRKGGGHDHRIGPGDGAQGDAGEIASRHGDRVGGGAPHGRAYSPSAAC